MTEHSSSDTKLPKYSLKIRIFLKLVLIEILCRKSETESVEEEEEEEEKEEEGEGVVNALRFLTLEEKARALGLEVGEELLLISVHLEMKSLS